MKIAVVNPATEIKFMRPLIPLGFGIVSKDLINSEFSVEQINLQLKNMLKIRKNEGINLELISKKYREYLENEDSTAIEKEIKKLIKLGSLNEYDILCFTVKHCSDYKILIPLFKYLKKNNGVTIIIGGPSIANQEDARNIIESPHIDYIVLGHSENTLSKLIEGKNPKKIPGVFYKKEDKIIDKEMNKADIEKQPLPFYNKKDIRLVKKILPGDNLYIPYQLGRGCPNGCTFCSYFDEQSYENKSIEKVRSDIKKLKEEYETDNFFFVDSNPMKDLDHLEEVAETIKDLDIYWGSQGLINNKDFDFYKKLSDSGCLFFSLGLESGSDKILSLMRKPYNSDIAHKSLKRGYKAGILQTANLIVKFPGEGEEEFKETLKFIKENSKYILRLTPSHFRVLNGTYIHQNPEEFNITLQQKEKDLDGLESYIHSKKGIKYKEGDKNFKELKKIKTERYSKYQETELKYIVPKNIYYGNTIKLVKYYLATQNTRALENMAFFLFKNS